MGLQTTMSTALTGMSAAETTIDVIGNNVANANTVGFKQSSVSFATQFLQTQSIGSSPTANRGGTNPRQVGLGVKVAEITPDFTQGTIEISSNPLDLAIQGDGFFIVQGPQGEQFYTRNGQFKTNANNEIVTVTGHRVLGYSVDADFNIQPTGLTPLEIPLGAAAVAQPTQNMKIKGTLDPNATVGTQPQLIRSGILSDGRKEVPVGDDIELAAQARPLVDSATATPTGVGTAIAAGDYRYRIAYVDANGNEGPASSAIEIETTAAAASIVLNGLPPTAPNGMTRMRIYRANADGPAANASFRLVDDVAPSAAYIDTATDASIETEPTLDDSGLTNGSYSYYVTFYNFGSGVDESRPTAVLGPQTADATNSPRIRLDDLPRPDADPLTGGYDGIRIYRNLANDPTSFHLVTELTPAEILAFGSNPISYIDHTPDASIAGSAKLDLEGPPINFETPLVNVVQRDGSNYINLFKEGELTFTGDKGGRDLATRSLTITQTTTVVELLDFMEQTMGVLEGAEEDTFPDGTFGGTIVRESDGSRSRLQFTSNMGVQNALSIDLSAFRLTPDGAQAAQSVPLRFTTTQTANGEGAAVDATVYDSLGSPLRVRITTVLEERSSTGAVFRWIASSNDTHPDVGQSTQIGSGTFTTGSDGAMISVSNDRISLQRGDSPAESPLEIKLDFSQISALAGQGNSLNQGETDGSPAGTLTSFIISDTGSIQGLFSNGGTRDLGQIRMALFSNNAGLEQVGDNMFQVGVNSGLPIFGDPGSQGIGAVSAGAVELSNTDIGQNLIELILASTQYRGGARVITAAQELLDELLALRR